MNSAAEHVFETMGIGYAALNDVYLSSRGYASSGGECLLPSPLEDRASCGLITCKGKAQPIVQLFYSWTVLSTRWPKNHGGQRTMVAKEG